MPPTLSIGSRVKWAWGQGYVFGMVKEKHEHTVQRTLQEALITRHGSPENPAYLIEQDNGSKVLKLHSEIEGS